MKKKKTTFDSNTKLSIMIFWDGRRQAIGLHCDKTLVVVILCVVVKMHKQPGGWEEWMTGCACLYLLPRKVMHRPIK